MLLLIAHNLLSLYRPDNMLGYCSTTNPNNTTLWVKKLDPFSFEHNFAKYCPIILSLLQTEINYDKVYHKIYHHTSNLLVHCWHDFVIKDATV